MTPPKETLDAVGIASKTATPSGQVKPDLNRLRADAVSLDVPVRVHGSRVREVVRGVTPHTEPFEEEASTMIVFPHGGVVRMATAVSVGQMLVLTSLRTNQDAICRVVKVRAYSNSQSYVEVEFTHRQVGYWGVRFPADDEELPPAAAPPTSAVPEPEKKPVVSSVTVRVEAMPKAPAALAQNESAFAPIGSQEDVQPPAAHTELQSPATHIAPPAGRLSALAPVVGVALPVAHKVAPSAHSVVAPMEATNEATESDTKIEEPRTFGTLTGGTGRTGQAAVSSDFGARLDLGVSTQHPAATPSNNWMWIGACVFFLVVGLAGGAFYFREHSTERQARAQAPAAVSQPVAPPSAAPVAESPAPQQETLPDESIASAQAPASATAERPYRTVPSASEQPPRLAENALVRELRPAAPATPSPSTVEKTFAPTNARPLARANDTSRMGAPALTTAPSVSAATGGSETLPGVLGSSEAAPPPPPPSQPPLTRVRVGGVIAQPKLLHSVSPNYPSAARSAGISGNVVILAHVDKTGNVASMKVVSGPATLQAAATSALRSWKYQPATLDGVPIATDVTVTIRFQRQ